VAINAEKALAWISGNIVRVLLGALGVVTVLLAYLSCGESGAPPLPSPEVQARPPKIAINPYKEYKAMAEAPPNNVDYQKVQLMVDKRVPFEQSQYEPLSVFNMFDSKSARNTEEQEKRADQVVQQAQQMADAGNLTGAKEKLAEVRKFLVNYAPAERLMRVIDQKLTPQAATPTATPAAGRPAGTPTAAATPAN